MIATRRILIPLLLLAVAAALVVLVMTTANNATVTVEWSTASELDTAGFNLYRGDTKDGPFTRINPGLIPSSPDPLIGGSYVFTDTAVVAGRTYYYQLEDVDTNGTTTAQGVVEVKAEGGLDPTALVVMTVVIVIVIVLSVFVPRKRQPGASNADTPR